MTIDLAFQTLRRLEGCRLSAYQDQGGVWTIGYGHTGPEVKEGLVWSQTTVDSVFRQDVYKAVGTLTSAVPKIGALSDGQFAALVCFIYNVGPNAFLASTILKVLNGSAAISSLSIVPSLLAKWIYVRIRGIPTIDQGLVKRRAEEIKLWRMPDASLPS